MPRVKPRKVGPLLKPATDKLRFKPRKAAGGSGSPNRVDRGDGRDARGRFTGKQGYGKDYESKGIDRYEARTGRTVERQQVRATVDGVDHGRFFDGLAKKPDGTYEAIEVKGGTATKNAPQRAFDDAISPSNPAHATLPDGTRITITSVRLETVK